MYFSHIGNIYSQETELFYLTNPKIFISLVGKHIQKFPLLISDQFFLFT